MKLPQTMLIAQNISFGPPEVVKVVAVALPTPKKGQILVRVRSSTVSAADWRLRSRNVPRGFGFIMGLLFGFSRPKYSSLGTDLAGEVVAIGEGVTRFTVGDRVVANLGMTLGGHAQYALLKEKAALAKLPSTISFEDAAALVFGGTTALYYLRDKLQLKKGERLLVIGAGGSVGSAAVQIGRELGAEVVGVCSTEKAALVKKIGAHRVIDYRKSDWRKDQARYDVICDTVGGVTLQNTKYLLTEGGRIGLVVADLPTMLASAWLSLTQQHKLVTGSGPENSPDLEYLVSLCSQGRFRPVISETFPLEKIVEAHRRVDSGHKAGNVVVVMG
jgi:NADPH:quinone reductase-like Zn-dependent oxidoreductase